MKPSDSFLIFFFIFASFAILSTFFIIFHFFYLFDRKCFFSDRLAIRLFFLLHFTVFLQEWVNLPFLWISPSGLCSTIAWLRYYLGLMNIVILFFLSLHYFSYLTMGGGELLTIERINQWIFKYSLYFIVGFPLITLFPFFSTAQAGGGSSSSGGYHAYRDMWCILDANSGENANLWAMGIFYFWILLLLFLIVCQFIFSLYRIRRYQLNINPSLLILLGSYIFISIICWLARVIIRLAHFTYSYYPSNLILLETTYPLYLSGILYALVYFWYIRAIKQLNLFDLEYSRGIRLSSGSTINIQAVMENIEITSSVGNTSNKSANGNGGGTSRPIIRSIQLQPLKAKTRSVNNPLLFFSPIKIYFNGSDAGSNGGGAGDVVDNTVTHHHPDNVTINSISDEESKEIEMV